MKREVPRLEKISLSSIEIGDYACHVINQNLVKLLVNQPEKMMYHNPLLLSERDNSYFLIRDF